MLTRLSLSLSLSLSRSLSLSLALLLRERLEELRDKVIEEVGEALEFGLV
jgi:hypothetical protein